ncbi:MAG: nucleotidyltransferase domain-containing protein [Candidatus Omnitrophica bacterium]|nr:nucleotidyltransferase domain-containing protein [Candidatus Omnitrophota bacterium]
MSPLALQQELHRVIRQLRCRYRPDAIILFGSLARGRTHAQSDIDLVVVKRTRKPFIERLRDVALLHHAHVGVDILVYTPDEWRRLQQNPRGFIAKEIVQRGRVLYRAA